MQAYWSWKPSESKSYFLLFRGENIVGKLHSQDAAQFVVRACNEIENRDRAMEQLKAEGLQEVEVGTDADVGQVGGGQADSHEGGE